MPNREPLSRGGITSRTGVPNDVLTYWLRYNLVRPIAAPDGPGRHLRFHWYEANIAAVMNELRQLGVNIDGLLSIGEIYREAIEWAEGYGLDHDDMGALHTVFIIHSHYAHHQDADELAHDLESWSQERHGKSRVTERIKAIHAKMTKDEFYRHLDPFQTITAQPKPTDPGVNNANAEEMTFFWRINRGEQYRLAWGPSAGEQAREDGALAMIAVDVSAVLVPVWNRPGDEA
jgi:hypothetical protein